MFVYRRLLREHVKVIIPISFLISWQTDTGTAWTKEVNFGGQPSFTIYHNFRFLHVFNLNDINA